MALAISGSFANLFAAAAAGSNNAATAPKPQPLRTNTADTVQVTQGQQVRQLYSQGHTVSQIASSLNLTAQAVDTYLNISTVGK